MSDEVSDAPPPITNRDIMADFFTLNQSLTYEVSVVNSQVQAMTTQINRDTRPRVP